MKTWHWILLAVIFAATVVASFFDPKTPSIYYAMIGFGGCLLLLFLTKVVGKKLLARKEGYYDAS